jgi:hypothetical protein
MGYIDPASGQYIYDADDTFAGVPVQDVLNRSQEPARVASLADRARITTLESQVGSALGVSKMSADQTVGPGDATVALDTTELSAGVVRSGTSLVPQTTGIYLASFGFSSIPSNANTSRDVWLERWVSGAWTKIPLSQVSCAMGVNGTGQYASLAVPMQLAADGTGVRMRTNGSSGAASVVIKSGVTFLSLVKVSG